MRMPIASRLLAASLFLPALGAGEAPLPAPPPAVPPPVVRHLPPPGVHHAPNPAFHAGPHAHAMAMARAHGEHHAGPPVERPWLGLAVSSVPPTLAHQLRLVEGCGLQVDLVVPDSPAAKAGVETHDVLVRLDDQVLINPEQFSVLVHRTPAAGSLALRLIRRGVEQTITVTPVPRLEAPGRHGDVLRLLRSHMPAPPPSPPGVPDLQPGAGALLFRHVLPPSISLADGAHAVQWDGQRDRLLVTTKNGEVLFDGPAADARTRTDLPPLARHLLDMHTGGAPSAAPIEAGAEGL